MTPGRLDQFWVERLLERPVARAKVQEWIKAGLAVVDGIQVRKASHRLRGGEAVELEVPDVCATPREEEGDLTVVYSDGALAVVNKPAGLTVHPAPSCPEGTLVNRLLRRFPELGRLEGQRPGIVHRIDKDTSGLLLVALSEPVRLRLSAAFAGREVKKTYLALVHGRPAKVEGEIDAPIGRDAGHKTRMSVMKGGREAHSGYSVVWTSEDERVSLAEVSISTGRTHQIRVHMAHIGHPLVGDALYGAVERGKLKKSDPTLHRLAHRQMLHAWRLGFVHPQTGEEMRFEVAPPIDFWRMVLLASRRMRRMGVVGLPGSGKSAVMRMLEERGVPVWSADRCVAELYEPGRDGWTMLRARFGERFVPKEDGPVDKKALFEAMRGSERFRRELMELLYPMVAHRLEEFFAEHGHARAAFAEVPMLLEAGWATNAVREVIWDSKGRSPLVGCRGKAPAGVWGGAPVDHVVGVSCPTDIRHERLTRRGWDQATIALMDSWQWPQEKKLAACGYVVDNSGSWEQTQREVDALLVRLRGERREKIHGLLAWMRARGYT